ncbi:MAG: formate dehydrogenase accessory sulfurtransferase FdhD [Candidatus Bathyarchaeia archaeon]
MREVEILRIDVSGRLANQMRDCVAQEKPLHLFLNRKLYATIFCTPSKLKELAVGHLFSEGIVKSIEEIEEVNLKKDVCRVKLTPSVDLDKRLSLSKHFQRVILSACGSKGTYVPSQRLSRIKSSLTVKAETVLDCVKYLNRASEIFRKTGGVHAAAIFSSDGTLMASAEDVGRHNAVDKVIGITMMRKTNLGKCFLALTGRMTGDIVMKAARLGVPVVASMAAAIDSGIAIAKKADLTLVGFVRGKRMNVYSVPERILL